MRIAAEKVPKVLHCHKKIGRFLPVDGSPVWTNRIEDGSRWSFDVK